MAEIVEEFKANAERPYRIERTGDGLILHVAERDEKGKVMFEKNTFYYSPGAEYRSQVSINLTALGIVDADGRVKILQKGRLIPHGSLVVQV